MELLPETHPDIDCDIHPMSRAIAVSTDCTFAVSYHCKVCFDKWKIEEETAKNQACPMCGDAGVMLVPTLSSVLDVTLAKYLCPACLEAAKEDQEEIESDRAARGYCGCPVDDAELDLDFDEYTD